MENMVAEIPAYRAEVEHRQDFARNRTEELLAVADVPFEHEVALRDKEHELHTLTAQLLLDANSSQAHARAEAARERLAAQGRTPGWSLALNPTPALLREKGEGSAGPVTMRELVTADVVAPNGVADAQASPDPARMRCAWRGCRIRAVSASSSQIVATAVIPCGRPRCNLGVTGAVRRSRDGSAVLALAN